MQLRVSFAVLAVAAGLAGCATDADTRKSGTGSDLAVAGDSGASGSGVKGGTVIADPMPDDPGRGMSAELRRSVYYEFDRYDVKPEYRALVERNAAWLRANPSARLVITGNSDERGPSEYNLALGQKRAESVTRLLVVLGAKPGQIEAVSFGKEKPRAQGHDETAWAENRRADFARP